MKSAVPSAASGGQISSYESGDGGHSADSLAILRAQARSLVSSATEIGIELSVLAEVFGDAIRLGLDDPIRDGYATAEEGLGSLLGAEGGCVNVATACALFRKPNQVTRQAMNLRIREGGIIAYKTGGGEHMVPVWQFRPEGGLLPGLPETLSAIRSSTPRADALTPFAFFLQAHPLTAGKRPIDALRAGAIDQVLAAAAANAG